MFKKHYFSIACIIFITLRTLFGLVTNFNHEDITQVFLIGLKFATSGEWEFWGADIVWNNSRVPGGLLAVLIGLPIKITNSPASPIILANILNSSSLLFIWWYAQKRIPSLDKRFTYLFLMVLPWGIYASSSILNTSYLLVSSTLFFINLLELRVYSNNKILSNWFVFGGIGFSIPWAFQLHLGWLLLLPYLGIQFITMIKEKNISIILHNLHFFFIGCLLSSSTVIPTLHFYGMGDASSNITLNPTHALSIFDLFFRFTTLGSFEILAFNFINEVSFTSFTILKQIKHGLHIINVLFVLILWSLLFVKKNNEWRKVTQVFIFSMLLAYISYCFTNKYIETRSFIILLPVPIWYTLYCWDFLFRHNHAKIVGFGIVCIFFCYFTAIGFTNMNKEFSLSYNITRINLAIEKKDPLLFGKRRQ